MGAWRFSAVCRIMTHAPAYREISAALGALAQDALLFVPNNFIERVKAIDFLELHGLDDSALKRRLDEANEALFAQLLTSIRALARATFSDYFRNVAQQSGTPPEETLGYDE